jgi:hypothetical protein
MKRILIGLMLMSATSVHGDIKPGIWKVSGRVVLASGECVDKPLVNGSIINVPEGSGRSYEWESEDFFTGDYRIVREEQLSQCVGNRCKYRRIEGITNLRTPVFCVRSYEGSARFVAKDKGGQYLW